MRMKKSALVIVLALLTVAGTEAGFSQALYVGAKGGLNVSTADFDGAFIQDEATRSGLNIGAVFALDFSRLLRLQAEGLYSQKGVQEDNGVNNLDLAYFEIPLLAILRIRRKVSPHLFVGPVLSLEVSCNVTSDDPPVNNRNCDDVAETPRTKSADVGVMFGLGVDLGLGRGTVILDAAYNVGLTNLSEQPLNSIKNKTFYLTAGILYPLFPIAG